MFPGPYGLHAAQMRSQELLANVARRQLLNHALITFHVAHLAGDPQVVHRGALLTALRRCRPLRTARIGYLLPTVLVLGLLGMGGFGPRSPGVLALESSAGSRGPSSGDGAAACSSHRDRFRAGMELFTLRILSDEAVMCTPVLASGEHNQFRCSGFIPTAVDTHSGCCTLCISCCSCQLEIGPVPGEGVDDE
jgi:hypothetical protein